MLLQVFGKSLIIDSIIASQQHSNIFIIVPTIALIDETRKRYLNLKIQYKINHSSKPVFFSTQYFYFNAGKGQLEIIPDVNVDFFVIDEFYKLSPQKTDEERCHVFKSSVLYVGKEKTPNSIFRTQYRTSDNLLIG